MSYDIVDSHTHVFPTPADADAFRGGLFGDRPTYPGDAADAIRTMDRLGIRKCVILPWYHAQKEPDPAKAAETWSAYNSWAWETARTQPDRFAAMVAVNPVLMSEEWVRGEIERGFASGAAGFKLIPYLIGCSPSDPRMAVVWEAADRLGVPIVSQSGLVPANDWAQPNLFEEAVSAHPRAKLILAHAGMGVEEQTIALAAKYPNVFVDTSAWFDIRPDPKSWLNEMLGSPAYSMQDAADFFRAVGIDRVLFGTNYAIRDPDATLAGVMAMPLTESERQQVFSENYRRVFDDA